MAILLDPSCRDKPVKEALGGAREVLTCATELMSGDRGASGSTPDPEVPLTMRSLFGSARWEGGYQLCQGW